MFAQKQNFQNFKLHIFVMFFFKASCSIKLHIMFFFKASYTFSWCFSSSANNYSISYDRANSYSYACTNVK